MPKVKILPEALINKIAAGEVVERPASVVKELVENAIDAGSDQIFVTIKNGGKDYISVLDNGVGMTEEDANMAVERHATSKISTSEDLENISTMGFRGEALAAIAAVSRFELTTCGDAATGGYQLRIEGGKITHSARMGFPKGTRMVVENLFFNTPARQKFMKSVNTEYNHVHDLIIRLALCNPTVQFRLTHNKNLVLNIPKETSFRQRIAHCFGNEIADSLIECEHRESYLTFKGLISDPSKSRGSKRWQHTFVNGRYVKCNSINHAIYEGYKTLLMKNMHPLFFLNVDLPPGEIDVNVHPAKTEIRLKNANLVHTILAGQISLKLKHSERKQFIRGDAATSPQDNDPDKSFQETKTTANSTNNTNEEALNQASTDPQVYIEKDDQISFLSPATSENSRIQPRRPKPKEPLSTPETLPREDAEADAEESNPFSFADTQPFKPDVATSQTATVSEEGFEVVGQFLNKYIVVQGEEKLILVDQHAAHERIRFEEIKRQFYSNNLQTQPLLVPMIIELPPQDGLLFEQYKESFEKLGFVIDHFGGNDYSVKEIPMILKDVNIEQVIKEVLDEMSLFGKSGKLELFFNEIFEKMACHSAIRASQTLSQVEMKALINQLIQYDIMLHCPHGRPVWIEFSVDELDKRFKRI